MDSSSCDETASRKISGSGPGSGSGAGAGSGVGSGLVENLLNTDAQTKLYISLMISVVSQPTVRLNMLAGRNAKLIKIMIL